MPIVNMDFELIPPEVVQCRKKRIRAQGRATAAHALRTRARQQAKIGATFQRRRAANAARGLICPPGTCPRGPCELIGIFRMGFGDSWTDPVRVGNRWEVTYTRWYWFDVVCRCSRH